MIKLIKNTIDRKEIADLCDWLLTDPRLTKGDLTTQFEKKWSEYLGVKYSVFVNSGSSANLAATYALLLSNRLKNSKIVVPAVSWATTVSPAIQLGFTPIMCDCDKNNLGLDIDHLKDIIVRDNPGSIILVHVLGFPNCMDDIVQLCKENDIFLIEDTCESLGSKYKGQMLGTFGDLSTFSFYYGHHISTIEGGMVSTNNAELYNILLSIRSHGWDRDLPTDIQQSLRKEYNVDEFNAMYTFYYPGFNIRSTDLQAFLGLSQLKKLDSIVSNRNSNYRVYNELIKNDEWKITTEPNSYISNFAYPIITKNIKSVIRALTNNDIECRPLICGSMANQPFVYNKYGRQSMPNADRVHEYGLYVPNNHEMDMSEILKIIEVVNENL